MPKPDIDQMPILTATLGKYRTERIRYHQKGTGRRQPAATNLTNDLIGLLVEYSSPYTQPIEDILVCAANSADGAIPLSVQRIFNILQCIPIINTREVSIMLAVDERHARRYVRACKFALPFLEKELLLQDF